MLRARRAPANAGFQDNGGVGRPLFPERGPVFVARAGVGVVAPTSVAGVRDGIALPAVGKALGSRWLSSAAFGRWGGGPLSAPSDGSDDRAATVRPDAGLPASR